MMNLNDNYDNLLLLNNSSMIDFIAAQFKIRYSINIISPEFQRTKKRNSKWEYERRRMFTWIKWIQPSTKKSWEGNNKVNKGGWHLERYCVDIGNKGTTGGNIALEPQERPLFTREKWDPYHVVNGGFRSTPKSCNYHFAVRLAALSSIKSFTSQQPSSYFYKL